MTSVRAESETKHPSSSAVCVTCRRTERQLQIGYSYHICSVQYATARRSQTVARFRSPSLTARLSSPPLLLSAHPVHHLRLVICQRGCQRRRQLLQVLRDGRLLVEHQHVQQLGHLQSRGRHPVGQVGQRARQQRAEAPLGQQPAAQRRTAV